MASFGAQLKREREQRKVSLDDISVSTKIGTRFLRAIEENHFEQLPGGIFNKGFVRAYARHLGLDEEQTVADFLEATGAETSAKKPDTPVPVIEPPEPSETAVANIPWGGLAVVLLVAALSIAIWSVYSRQAQSRPDNSTNTGSVSRAISEPAPVDRVKPAATPPQTHSPSNTTLLASSAATPPSPGSFAVTIKARDDSWMSVTVDGTQLPGETLLASSEKSFQAHHLLVLKAGNVGAVEVYFNGSKLPPQGDEGEVKTLSFDAHGLRVPVKAEAPAPN